MSSRLHLPIFSLIIAITTTLLLINQRQTHGQNVQGRSHQSNQLYREEFETYETLQRNQNPPQQSAIRQEQGEGPLRTRYVEFAETEFKRPSVYWPVPFLSPFNNRVQTIPARTLSQLIRQHIAHNRMKQLALQNLANPILQGVSQITELRQTPFRRWPSSSPKNQNYQEKRRQWKAELNRRLNGQKVPARVIPPLLISGGGQSSIQTDREPDDRYFVTYSPRTRIYQVSRRPPPFLYTTNRDILPEQLDNQQEVPITAEPVAEKKRKMSEGKPRTQTTAIRTTTTTTASSSFAPSTEATTTTTSSTSTSTTTTTAPPTSTEIPILVILQEAEPIVGRVKEQKQIFPALVKPALSTNTQAKQILFLDDYEQPQDEDDEWEPREDRGQPTPTTTTSAPRTVSSISIQTQTSPIIYSSRPKVERTKELEDAREKLRQQLFQPREEDDDDNFVEEEDGDEDLFFFKPGGLAGREGEPFRILVHDQGRKKL